MFIRYTFGGLQLLSDPGSMHFYVLLRREDCEDYKQSMVYLVMYPWVYMYNVREYFRGNDLVGRTMEMISKK